MKPGTVVAAAVVVGGGWYFLTKSGALAGTGLGLDAFGVPIQPDGPSAADLARANALRQPAPGNAPIAAASSSSFVASGGLGALAGLGAATLPLFGLGGVALGITTAGIGLAVAFLSYELLKQRASMHTNDVRDQWTKQFVSLHDALGLTPLTAAQTRGSGVGSVEMGEVIFNFDHDSAQRLWHAVEGTQDERTFRAAAANVDAFLRSHGVPVQDVA